MIEEELEQSVRNIFGLIGEVFVLFLRPIFEVFDTIVWHIDECLLYGDEIQ